MQEVTTLPKLLRQIPAARILFVLVVPGVVVTHTCTAGMGCRSYVNGHNLSNCTDGGCGGWMCNGDAWGPRHPSCSNCRICGIFGADFGMMGMSEQNQDTDIVTVHIRIHLVVEHLSLSKVQVGVTNEAWCHVVVTLIGTQVVDKQE